MPVRNAFSRASSTRSPTDATNEAPCIVARAGKRCVAAFSVVSSTTGLAKPAASAAKVDIRRARISGLGETRS